MLWHDKLTIAFILLVGAAAVVFILRDVIHGKYALGDYREGDESIFEHEGKLFKVDDILRGCVGKPIRWMNRHAVEKRIPYVPVYVSDFSGEHSRRVTNADLRYPVVLIVSSHSKRSIINIADGWHRVSKVRTIQQIRGLYYVTITESELLSLPFERI